MIGRRQSVGNAPPLEEVPCPIVLELQATVTGELEWDTKRTKDLAQRPDESWRPGEICNGLNLVDWLVQETNKSIQWPPD